MVEIGLAGYDGDVVVTAGGRSLSKLIETRAEFQELANERLEEAKALLDVGKWNGAYYLAGYAVEIALKACIIKTLMSTDAFPEKEFSMELHLTLQSWRTKFSMSTAKGIGTP